MEPENIGFISTRFAGTDGVSLEAKKWAQVFEEYGHCCYWFAGRLDHPPAVATCVPEAFFGHPENVWINSRIWGIPVRARETTARINRLASYLKDRLYAFIDKHSLKILVIQNASTIPMHVPLGLAIAELLAETRIPAIAHHHDFYWERTRFSVNAVNDYLGMCFPPVDPDLQHVTINQEAQEELARRRGVSSIVIPNVLDFETPSPPGDIYSSDVRSEMGLTPDDVLILQPTRVVPRKGIEHAIALLEVLGDPRYKLVVSHEAGDEGLAYMQALSKIARRAKVDLRFFETRVGDTRTTTSEGKKVYTLWDIYPHADFITYPSIYEGFGNALLEAFYFRKPVLVNRYGTFARDIEPRGFRVPIMEGYLSDTVVDEVRRLIEDHEYRREVVDHNFDVAKRHYSYAVLRRSLRTLLTNIRGLGDA